MRDALELAIIMASIILSITISIAVLHLLGVPLN